MTLIDITVTLREGLPEWPGDAPFSCGWTWEIARGASVNVSRLSGSPHVGTHADAPLHVTDGSSDASELPLESFVGSATVVDVTAHRGTLELADLASTPNRNAGRRLLLKTGCTIANGSFPESWPVLSASCIRTLLGQGLLLLGVDAPSVDARESRTLEIHRALFAHGACILENLDLRHVQPGEYLLQGAPLKIAGADAAPVRALLQTSPR